MNGIPLEFWYAVLTILVSILIWVVRTYFASLQTTIKDIEKSIQQLTRMLEVHGNRLDNAEDDIRELRNHRRPR